MSAFSWTCPFCNQHTTVTDLDTRNDYSDLRIGNKYGAQYLYIKWIVCPNTKCKEITLSLNLHEYIQKVPGGDLDIGKLRKKWRLLPPSEAKVFPDYIPDALRQDYLEACLINQASPKASATLARRCLQGMIRDFWKISKRRLVDEIDAIKNKVDPSTWKAIDAVRRVGNIGAHMGKDINLIIDVDPDEATLLINLIETLMKDWYINRHERNELMEAVINVSLAKKASKGS